MPIALVVAFVKHFALVKKTFAIVFAAAAALAHVGAAADGVYQKTRDGKSTVWNSEPKPGDEATWSGERDHNGYAKGFGTLTWYSVDEETGGRAGKPALFARYFGRMEHGKLNGPVNVHAKGQTRYAIFVEGERMTKWKWGAAPARAFTEAAAIAAKTKREPEAPAQGPPETKTPSQAETRSTSEEKPKRAVAAAQPQAQPNESLPAAPKPGQSADNSLRLLTGPPSSLRYEPPPPAEGPAEPRLTSDEVTGAGDESVRSHGFNPSEFVRGEPKFDAKSGTWTVPYNTTNSEDPNAKGFAVTVDDATKGTVFVPMK